MAENNEKIDEKPKVIKTVPKKTLNAYQFTSNCKWLRSPGLDVAFLVETKGMGQKTEAEWEIEVQKFLGKER